MNPAQISAMFQVLNSDPIARRNAESLTQRLQQQGQIGASQNVIGFQNGTVYVTSGGQSFGSPLNGFPVPPAGTGPIAPAIGKTVTAPAAGTTTGTAATNTGTTGATPGLTASALIGGLGSANTQSFNAQSIVDANAALGPNDLTALSRALAGNAQAHQTAAKLTQVLQAQGLIGANQQVVGVRGNQVFVTGANGIAPNAFSQLPAQAGQMLTGLTGLNMTNLPAFSVNNVTTTLPPAEVALLTQALAANPRAMQIAQTFTQQLRAAGRIGPAQTVIGFRDGQVFVVGNP